MPPVPLPYLSVLEGSSECPQSPSLIPSPPSLFQLVMDLSVLEESHERPQSPVVLGLSLHHTLL